VNYRIKFDWSDEFTKVITALLKTRDHLKRENHRMTVTQLGDFVDLWRESLEGPKGAKDIMESFPYIRDRFLRKSEDSVSARLLLGNHDLDARKSAIFARARMSHYLPGTGWTLMATHGDIYDYDELFMPDIIATIVLQILGRIPKPRTFPMQKLRDLQEKYPPNDNQGDATFAEMGDAGPDLPSEFNVITVTDEQKRQETHKLLPLAIKAAKNLRTAEDPEGNIVAPQLKVMVLGHTHHARLIVDKIDDLILMDCGGWIGNYKVGQQQARPNRQLGAVCGSDLRIYQVDVD
jgi:UDP-2,3-diacylglucosamine pyrophosphatase LpxH